MSAGRIIVRLVIGVPVIAVLWILVWAFFYVEATSYSSSPTSNQYVHPYVVGFAVIVSVITLLFLVGIIRAIAGPARVRCPHCKELVIKGAQVCRYCSVALAP